MVKSVKFLKIMKYTFCQQIRVFVKAHRSRRSERFTSGLYRMLITLWHIDAEYMTASFISTKISTTYQFDGFFIFLLDREASPYMTT